LTSTAYARTHNDSLSGDPKVLKLADCIHYALQNQAALKQSQIDESVAKTNNWIGFSGWMPQVNGSAIYNHYYQLPTAFSGNQQIVSGAPYVAIPSVTATQTIFSNDVFLAASAAHLNTKYASQNTEAVKIGLISNVTKAFYDLLLTLEQINVLKEDTARLSKNKQDTYYQYMSGIVDKVDYKQATIALNNTTAQLKSANEIIAAKYATLNQLIGLVNEQKYTVAFDTAQMMQEVYFDTSELLDYNKRIEYRQLQVSKRFQKETTLYYQLGFLPSISAFYNYNYEYESTQYSTLFNNAYPYSLFGLTLNIPIFQGFRRIENIHKSKLQEQRVDWDEVNLKLSIISDYKRAISEYKSNAINLVAQGENVQLAKEVYNIVQLQYKEGIKTYLNVITAESDLRTSEINYLNALFQLLSSKIDLQRAMGDINPNQ